MRDVYGGLKRALREGGGALWRTLPRQTERSIGSGMLVARGPPVVGQEAVI